MSFLSSVLRRSAASLARPSQSRAFTSLPPTLASRPSAARPSPAFSRINRSTASYSESSGNKTRITTSASLPASAERPATSAGAPRRPVGPFRAGLMGFLTGSVIAGIVTYFYILKEYRISNELLMGDIYSLQAAVQRTESYVRTLEDKVDTKQKRRLGD